MWRYGISVPIISSIPVAFRDCEWVNVRTDEGLSFLNPDMRVVELRHIQSGNGCDNYTNDSFKCLHLGHRMPQSTAGCPMSERRRFWLFIVTEVFEPDTHERFYWWVFMYWCNWWLSILAGEKDKRSNYFWLHRNPHCIIIVFVTIFFWWIVLK